MKYRGEEYVERQEDNEGGEPGQVEREGEEKGGGSRLRGVIIPHCLVTFQTKLLICGAKKKRRGKASESKRRGRMERDEGSDCTVPLEAQSPLETVAVLDHSMTVQQ